jgi:hypothetical protein
VNSDLFGLIGGALIVGALIDVLIAVGVIIWAWRRKRD